MLQCSHLVTAKLIKIRERSVREKSILSADFGPPCRAITLIKKKYLLDSGFRRNGKKMAFSG
jgi:hypothetical protein